MKDRIIRIVSENKLFFLLFIIGIFLRFYEFEGFITFLGDQGRDALIVKRIVTFEHFPAVGAPSSIGQIYLGPFYYYLISPFLILTWFNPLGLALGVAVLWLAGIALSYFIIKKQLGIAYALLFSSLILFASTLIDLSRFSWNPNLLPLFSFFTLFFLYIWLKEKKIVLALTLGSFLAFSVQLHHLALLLFIPVVLGALYFIWNNHTDRRRYLQQGIAALGAFFFFSIPLIIFDLRHNFLNTKNFIALFAEGKVAAENPYGERLVQTIDSFFSFALHLELPQGLLLIIFLLFIGLAVVLIKKKKSIFLLLHLITFIVFMLGFSYVGSQRIPHYFAPVYLSFYILLAGLPFLLPGRVLQLVGGTIMLLFFLVMNAPHYYYLWTQPPHPIAYARTIAESFEPYVTKEPIQIVALPHTETDGHVRYFLDLEGYDVLPHDSPAQPEALYILCRSECNPTGDGQWQIAAFENKKLQTSWQVRDVTIYKIVHGAK